MTATCSCRVTSSAVQRPTAKNNPPHRSVRTIQENRWPSAKSAQVDEHLEHALTVADKPVPVELLTATRVTKRPNFS